MNSTSQNTLAQNANALMREWIGVRKQIQVWLYLDKSIDVETLEIIQSMKSKREFRRSLMLGLKIVWEAGQGKFDTFFATYPNATDKIKPPPPDNTDLLNEILANQRKLMEQGITAPLPPTGGLTMTAQPASTGKTLGGFKALEAPKWEDEDDLPQLTTTKNTNNDSVKNFLNAMSGIAH